MMTKVDLAFIFTIVVSIVTFFCVDQYQMTQELGQQCESDELNLAEIDGQEKIEILGLNVIFEADGIRKSIPFS